MMVAMVVVVVMMMAIVVMGDGHDVCVMIMLMAMVMSMVIRGVASQFGLLAHFTDMQCMRRLYLKSGIIRKDSLRDVNRLLNEFYHAIWSRDFKTERAILSHKYMISDQSCTTQSSITN